MSNRKIITFKNVTAKYGERTILSNISFSINIGDLVYIVGPTGVGKSTILKLIYADNTPTSGEVDVEKYIVSSIKKEEVPHLRRRLGIVFQDFQLLSDRNVYDNIAFALKATGWKGSTRIKKRVTEVLVDVGMSAKVHAFPHQLSGGEQQRVAIARALINYPILLIADEPTGNLDPIATQNIMNILRKINQSGTAILMATHEYRIIKENPSRVLEVVQGGSLNDYQFAQDFLTQVWH